MEPVVALDFGNILESSRVLYTDGSGGPSILPQGRPVCGAGAAVIDFEQGMGADLPCVSKLSLMSSLLPLRQSVPRAEARAEAAFVSE